MTPNLNFFENLISVHPNEHIDITESTQLNV
jgi:hypothetical protein